MKVIVWTYKDNLDDLLKGEVVEYFDREPGFAEEAIQVIVDTDTYQRLKDEKNDEKYTGE